MTRALARRGRVARLDSQRAASRSVGGHHAYRHHQRGNQGEQRRGVRPVESDVPARSAAAGVPESSQHRRHPRSRRDRHDKWPAAASAHHGARRRSTLAYPCATPVAKSGHAYEPGRQILIDDAAAGTHVKAGDRPLPLICLVLLDTREHPVEFASRNVRAAVFAVAAHVHGQRSSTARTRAIGPWRAHRGLGRAPASNTR